MLNPIMAGSRRTPPSGAGPTIRANLPRVVRHALASGGVVAACALAAMPAGAATASAAAFVPEATRASWDGNQVQVSFRETGLAANTSAVILIEATGVADANCVKNGVTLFSTRSTATASDVSSYVADGSGTVNGARTLNLTVGAPTVTGLDCTMVVTRTFTVNLRDFSTGASLGLSGRPTGNGPA